MTIKHSITLSTTEPNNEVGVIKIRQADEQTQTLEVQITENGVPKSYQGLAVYFCAKLGQTAGLGIIEQKLKLEEMTDPANGKLEYTMRAEDWQILGRQKGYFSFRKMKDEHEFVEQFTTRDFTFDVIKSVFSDGLKEVKKDGSTYVWTIEDMLRLFDEYIESGKTDWEEFVEQNREILESVDPGGKLIGELIDARQPFGGETYATLGERLDSEKAEVTAQLTQNQKRIKNMIHIDFVEDCGAVGDGVTNNYQAFITLNQLIRNNGGYCRVLFPPGEYVYQPLLPLIGDWRGLVQIEGLSHIYYSGYGAKIKQIADINWNANGTPSGLHEHESPFQFRSTNDYDCHSIVMEGLEIVGDRVPYTGVDGSCSGIYLRGIEKFVGRDLTISGWGTDGVTVGRNYGNGDKCRDVLFNNVVCDNNTRQGMSVTGCDHFIIADSTFKNTNGGSFGHGLDFEPNVGRQRNVRVTNCRFENNARGALNFINTYDAVIDGCHIDEPSTNGAFYFDSNGDFAENIIIKNTTVITNAAIVYLGGRRVKNVKFIDCDFTTTGRTNEGATVRFVPPADNEVDKMKFENCLFKGLGGILTRIKGSVSFLNCDFEISNISALVSYPFALNVENEGIFIGNRFNIAEDVVFSSRYFTINSGKFDDNEMTSHSGSLVRLVDDRYDLGQYKVDIGRNKFSQHFYYLGEVYALNVTTDTRITEITALGRVVHGTYNRTTSGKNARVGDIVSLFVGETGVLRTYRCTEAGSPGVWKYQ